VELGWNWRESSPCNLLLSQRLSLDYTLLRSSISKTRPSSCDIRCALLRCIVCSHDDAVLVQAELLVPAKCCGSCAKLRARELHNVVRRYARAVRTAVVRLGDECVRLSFERRGAVLCCALIHQHWWTHPLSIVVAYALVVAEPCAWAGTR